MSFNLSYILTLVLNATSLLNSVCVWFASASSGLSSKSLNEWVCSFEAYLSSWLCVFREIVEGSIPFSVDTVKSTGNVALSPYSVNCYPPFTLI